VKVSPVRGGEFLANPSLLFLPPPYYSPTPNTIFRQKGPTNAAHNSNQSQKLWACRGVNGQMTGMFGSQGLRVTWSDTHERKP